MDWKDYLERGSRKFDSDKYKDAIKDFTKAIKLNSKHNGLFFLRGSAYYLCQKYQESIDDLNQYLKRDDKNLSALRLRGSAKHYLGEHEEAIEEFTKIIELDKGTDPSDFHQRGRAKLNLGEIEEAIIDFDKTIKLKIDNNAQYFASRGFALQRARLYEEAIHNYNEAIKLDPDESYFSFRGQIKTFLNLYQESIEDFDEAIKIEPENCYNLLFRGNSKYFLGEYKDAIKDYNRALAIQPDNSEFLFRRGKAKKELRELDDALLDFEKCKKIGSFIKQINVSLPVDFEIVQINFYKKNLNKINFNNFERSSITNFPKYFYQSSGNDELKKNLSDLIDKNYNLSLTDLNGIDEYQNCPTWHIKDFKDFYKLIEEIKKFPRTTKYRSIEELIELLEIIRKKNIDLFIIKENRNRKPSDYSAAYLRNFDFIVINYDYIFDIDKTCNDLTHELIHYFQKGSPLEIDIEDSIIYDVLNSNLYKTLSAKGIQMELEAATFASYPNFINKYLNKVENLKLVFYTSPKRLLTIKWICENKIIPIYPNNAYPPLTLDFNIDRKNC